MSTLALREITVAVADRRLIGPLSIEIAPGEILSLLGPSGVGKSSLLAFVCGVLPRALTGAGRVMLDGEEVTSLPPQLRRIGILFQDDLLFPHLSVGGNLAFGLRSVERSRRARARLIDQALETIGLAGFAQRDPATLSGGQRARVGLLRVLLSGPRALLLDEPFAHLDAQTRAATREFVFQEIRRRQLPTLLVTHDADDVRATGGACVELMPMNGDPSCSTRACNR